MAILGGLLTFLAMSVLFVDRDLPVRLRTLATGATPKAMEWREDVSEFVNGTRRNMEVISGENGGLSLRPGAVSGDYLSGIHLFQGKWNALGVEWQAQPIAQTHMAIEVHFSADGKKWNDWESVEADPDLAAENVNYSNLLFAGGARYLQYRVVFGTDSPLAVPQIHRIRFVAFDSTSPLIERARANQNDTGKRSLSIISRSEWGADESLMTRAPEIARPTKIIIHYASRMMPSSDPTATVRALYLYQAVTRGLGDLAYNYLIDAQGNIYEGRAGGDSVVAQHARQYSYGSIGIGIIGDFNSQPMSDESKKSLADLISYLANRHGINPEARSNFYDLADSPNVMLHSDLDKAADCPGRFLADALPEIHSLINIRQNTALPTLTLYGLSADKPLAGRQAVVAVSESTLTSRVEFYVDDKLEQSVDQPANGNQFAWEWDTKRYSDGDHILRIMARGKSQIDTVLNDKYRIDNTSPMAQLTINGGATFTRVPTITLTIRGTDATGIAQMQFVDPNGNAISPSEPFTTTKAVLLQPGDGARLIAMRFSDTLSNASAIATGKIILDTQAPENWRDFSGSANYASVLVSDKTSGIDLTRVSYGVSDDGATWGDWKPAHAEWDGKSQTVRLLIPEYVQKAWVRFLAADRAGNVSISQGFQIDAPTTMKVAALALPQDEKTIVSLGPSKSVSQTISTNPTQVQGSAIARPDLVIEKIEVPTRGFVANGPASFVVTIHNRGDANAGGFWVALWIDPGQTPQLNSADPTRDNLIMWYVPSLGTNEIMALASQNAYAPYTTFSGRIAEGLHQLYAMVDAVNPNLPSGLVLESDEKNNVSGPVTVNVPAGETNVIERTLLDIMAWREQFK